MTIEFDFSNPPVPPRDAATLILLRDGPTGLEVFFVKRRAEVRFMGGAYVFPGGKFDAADADASVPCDLSAEEAAARLFEADGVRARGLHVTALRECLEEAGVLLVHEQVSPDEVAAMRRACDKDKAPLGPQLRARGLTLRTSALVPLSRWVTPRGETRRFDARFFMAALPADVVATHDEGETVASLWLSPREALERAKRQEIVLVPPTYRTVEILSYCADTAAALALAPEPIPRLEPRVVPSPEGQIVIVLPGDPLHGEPAPRMTRPGTLEGIELFNRFGYKDGSWEPIPAVQQSP